MSLNGPVQQLCMEEKVGFADLWDYFVAKQAMYMRDGLHICGTGVPFLRKDWNGQLTGVSSQSVLGAKYWEPVGRKHSVMVRRAALRLTSTRRVWVLLHHTGAHYSADTYTSARVDVLSVDILAPQFISARRRINAVRVIALPRSAVRCSRYVSVL